jgi:hypothetical protein
LVVHTDKYPYDDGSELFKEVELNSLPIVEGKPLLIREIDGVSAVASVRISILRSLTTHLSFMDLIESSHVLV